MSASATIPPTPLQVEPGSEVSVFVQVRNTGEIVDQYTFEVLGEAAQWAKLDPPELSLFPGAEGEIKVSFAPPREATTQSGEIPFGLKVVSKEDPEDSVVEEGLLEVGTYADLGAELLPRTSRGRLAGKHELAFDNRGNRRINAQLTAADPDNKLRFRFSPPALVSPPGTAVFAKVAVRPKRKFLWGRPKTYPFKVFIESEGETPLAVDGTIFQEQLIPKWSTALVAVLGVLVLLWAFLLRPSIQDTATNAADAKTAHQQAQIDKLKKDSAAQAVQKAAKDAQNSANKAAAAAAATKAASATTQQKAVNAAKVAGAQAAAATLAKAANNNGAIPLATDCGTTCSPSLTVAKGKQFQLTDIVFQNPAGDSGTLQVLQDKTVLFNESLDNFRDTDFHFITPIIFNAGQKLIVKETCQNKPASGQAKNCTASVLVSGPNVAAPKKPQSNG
jgi:hypothetical protein